MRFIGNKSKLLTYVYEILKQDESLVGERFYDFFAGTASVGKYFKEKGYYVESADILYFSYVLQQAYLNGAEPKFEKLLKQLPLTETGSLFATNYERVLEHLNRLAGVPGFIYQNYTEEGSAGSSQVRKFFKGDNGQKIDAVRLTIEGWREARLITEAEYFILLATLVESVPFYANISGVYAAFLKSYDPRALKDFLLRPIKLSSQGPHGTAHHADSMSLVDTITTDILYLDPPYNARQYAPNYHLLETIAKYDAPVIKGVAGIRPYMDQKSVFCNAASALKALSEVAERAEYKVLALSYNSEGIMPTVAITEVLERHGRVKLCEVDYRRYKSNSNGTAKDKTHIQEQLFVLKRQ